MWKLLCELQNKLPKALLFITKDLNSANVSTTSIRLSSWIIDIYCNTSFVYFSVLFQLVCAFGNDTVNWILIMLGLVLSCGVLLLALWPAVRDDDRKIAIFILVFVFLLHAALAIGFKVRLKKLSIYHNFISWKWTLLYRYSKGLAMIFSGQEHPWIIFRSKKKYIQIKRNSLIPVKLLKLWRKKGF